MARERLNDKEDVRGERPLAGILFDFDGTLADTYELIMASFRHAAHIVLGHDVDEAPFAETIGIPLTAQMDLYTDDSATHDELLRVYRAFNETRAGDYITCFDGIPQVLDALESAGWPLGIVTSRRRVSAEAFLKICGIERHFPHLVAYDDGYAPKPDPEPVMAGAALIGCDPTACLYVGDSCFDMRAGRAAGAITVAAEWGIGTSASLQAERPRYLCARPLDLLDLPPLRR